MKKFRISLTARIFLMTSALMMAACAITYAAIAYLTPITYTAILADELDGKSWSLIEALEKVAPSQSRQLLDDFTRNTGASLTAWDERGHVLYGTVAASEVTFTAVEDMQYDDAVAYGAEPTVDAIVVQSDVTPSLVEDPTIAAGSGAAAQAGTALGAEARAAMTIETFSIVPGGMYAFAFADGTDAMLRVAGGVRPVNQATEALMRVLPFLAAVVALISLMGSFFYARHITRPIVSISQIARRIAALDFDARWTKRRSDEIGALGLSLNLLSDNLSGTLGQLEDANRALQRDIERERELERQRLNFFSAVSHELKTPITILQGQLNGMLAQVGVYRDREKYLARALKVTGRMEGLVREILTVSRIESGSFSLKAKLVDLGALLRRQLELDGELLEQKGLTLDTRIEPAVVQGDEALLSKVVSNVLNNAMLYSPPGASIFIEAGERAFSVENTGAQVPEEFLAQLFDPFYRVEQSRSRNSGGSGLGLYLVKVILNLHGATCRIENTERGVRFWAGFAQGLTPPGADGIMAKI